jgi:hypothetical protein
MFATGSVECLHLLWPSRFCLDCLGEVVDDYFYGCVSSTRCHSSFCRAQFFCRCFVLCAHALCSCFELCALCSVLMLCAYRGFWSPLAKHKACARSMRTEQMASSSRRALLLTKIGSFCRAWPSMSTKQPIMTKRCDFEH